MSQPWQLKEFEQKSAGHVQLFDPSQFQADPSTVPPASNSIPRDHGGRDTDTKQSWNNNWDWRLAQNEKNKNAVNEQNDVNQAAYSQDGYNYDSNHYNAVSANSWGYAPLSDSQPNFDNAPQYTGQSVAEQQQQYYANSFSPQPVVGYETTQQPLYDSQVWQVNYGDTQPWGRGEPQPYIDHDDPRVNTDQNITDHGQNHATLSQPESWHAHSPQVNPPGLPPVEHLRIYSPVVDGSTPVSTFSPAGSTESTPQGYDPMLQYQDVYNPNAQYGGHVTPVYNYNGDSHFTQPAVVSQQQAQYSRLNPHAASFTGHESQNDVVTYDNNIGSVESFFGHDSAVENDADTSSSEATGSSASAESITDHLQTLSLRGVQGGGAMVPPTLTESDASQKHADIPTPSRTSNAVTGYVCNDDTAEHTRNDFNIQTTQLAPREASSNERLNAQAYPVYGQPVSNVNHDTHMAHSDGSVHLESPRHGSLDLDVGKSPSSSSTSTPAVGHSPRSHIHSPANREQAGPSYINTESYHPPTTQDFSSEQRQSDVISDLFCKPNSVSPTKSPVSPASQSNPHFVTTQNRQEGVYQNGQPRGADVATSPVLADDPLQMTVGGRSTSQDHTYFDSLQRGQQQHESSVGNVNSADRNTRPGDATSTTGHSVNIFSSPIQPRENSAFHAPGGGARDELPKLTPPSVQNHLPLQHVEEMRKAHNSTPTTSLWAQPELSVMNSLILAPARMSEDTVPQQKPGESAFKLSGNSERRGNIERSPELPAFENTRSPDQSPLKDPVITQTGSVSNKTGLIASFGSETGYNQSDPTRAGDQEGTSNAAVPLTAPVVHDSQRMFAESKSPDIRSSTSVSDSAGTNHANYTRLDSSHQYPAPPGRTNSTGEVIPRQPLLKSEPSFHTQSSNARRDGSNDKFSTDKSTRSSAAESRGTEDVTRAEITNTPTGRFARDHRHAVNATRDLPQTAPAGAKESRQTIGEQNNHDRDTRRQMGQSSLVGQTSETRSINESDRRHNASQSRDSASQDAGTDNPRVDPSRSNDPRAADSRFNDSRTGDAAVESRSNDSASTQRQQSQEVDPREADYSNRDAYARSYEAYYGRPPSRADSIHEEYAKRDYYGDPYRREAYRRGYAQDEYYDRPRSRHDEQRPASRSAYDASQSQTRPGEVGSEVERPPSRSAYYDQQRPRSYSNYDYRGRYGKDYDYQYYYDQDYYQRQRYNRGYYEELGYYKQQHGDSTGYYSQEPAQPEMDRRGSYQSNSRSTTPALDCDDQRDAFARDFRRQGSRPASRQSQYEESPIYPVYRQQPRHRDSQDYQYDYSNYYNYYQQQQQQQYQEQTTTKQAAAVPKYSLPHISVHFSSSGHLVTVLPNRPNDGQTAGVEIHDIEHLLQEAPQVEELRLFPGPLVKGETHKNDVLVFCQTKARDCREDVTAVDRESAELIWRYLELLIKQNGTVVGTDIADLLLQGHEPTSRDLKAGGMTIDSSSDALDEMDTTCNTTFDRSLVNSKRTAAVDSVTDRFRHLLLYGRKKDSLEWAMKNNLWGHALFLASKMDTRTHANVMIRFANSSMHINDPLQTLYQLMSGRQPAAVTGISDEKWGDWRPHLAMVLSNSSDRMDIERKSIITLGDTLASRGCLHASHFCYLVASVSVATTAHKSPKWILIGANHNVSLDQFVTNSAIQCTEVYEYARNLGNPHASLPHFQAYKFLYTCRLAEYGYSAEAFHYCEVVSSVIQQSPGSYNKTLVSQLYQLSERLKYCDPERLHSGYSQDDPAWLTQLGSVYQGLQNGSIVPTSGVVTPQEGVTATSSESGDVPVMTSSDTSLAQYMTGRQSSDYTAGQARYAGHEQAGQAAYGQQEVSYGQPETSYGQQTSGYGQDLAAYTNAGFDQSSVHQYQQQGYGQEYAYNQSTADYSGQLTDQTGYGYPPATGQMYDPTQQLQGMYSGYGQNTSTDHSMSSTAAYDAALQGYHHTQDGGPFTQAAQAEAPQGVNGEVIEDENSEFGGTPKISRRTSHPHLATRLPATIFPSPNPSNNSTPTNGRKAFHFGDGHTWSKTTSPVRRDSTVTDSGAVDRDLVSSSLRLVEKTGSQTTYHNSDVSRRRRNMSESSATSVNSVKAAPSMKHKATENVPEEMTASNKKRATVDRNSKGFLGGLFSGFSFRRPAKNEMNLPDDKNPTIIWDDVKKRWVNKDGGDDEGDVTAAPPPKDTELTPAGAHPGSPASWGTPTENRFQRPKARGARDRYVDVLNKGGKSAPVSSTVPQTLFNVMPPTTAAHTIFTPGSNPATQSVTAATHVDATLPAHDEAVGVAPGTGPTPIPPHLSQDSQLSRSSSHSSLGREVQNITSQATQQEVPSSQPPTSHPHFFNPTQFQPSDQSMQPTNSGPRYGQRRLYPK